MIVVNSNFSLPIGFEAATMKHAYERGIQVSIDAEMES